MESASFPDRQQMTVTLLKFVFFLGGMVNEQQWHFEQQMEGCHPEDVRVLFLMDGTAWPVDGQRYRPRTQGCEPEYADADFRSVGTLRLCQADAQSARPAQLLRGAHGAGTASRRNAFAALANRGAEGSIATSPIAIRSRCRPAIAHLARTCSGTPWHRWLPCCRRSSITSRGISTWSTSRSTPTYACQLPPRRWPRATRPCASR